MNSRAWKTITLATSCLVILGWLLLWILSKLGAKKARAWLLPRSDPKATEKTLTLIRSLGRPVVLAFASSAGEYEQILPPLENLRSEGWSALVCFFSPSGIKFAKARKDEIPFVASPLDTLWHVHRFFDALQPQIVLVARQELWPCFLKVASERSSLYLVDAAVSSSKKRNGTLTSITNQLSMYHLFHHIFCVSKKDYDWFRNLGIPPEKLQITGDTKFDRAYQRLGKYEEKRSSITEDWLACYGDRHTLVVGSAWPEDLMLVLKAIQTLDLDIQVALVPHDPSPRMCLEMIEISKEFGFETTMYSKRQTKNSKEIRLDNVKLDSKTPRQIILVDQLGLLFEFYDVASWTWVGGALHHQVHNVLEPGIRGTPTAFGLNYHNSGEARDLVAEKLVLATDQPRELAEWIKRTPPKLDKCLLEAMQRKMGASEKIHEWIHQNKISKMTHTYLEKLQ